ncbi:MAG: ABC transporter permease, partial [Bacillota bacterium]
MSWVVFRGTFAKTLITMRRYLFNTLSGLVTMYLVFCLLFFGAQAMGGAVEMGDTLEGLVVGYFVWMLAVMAYSDLSWHLLNEAQVGTLEQMYLTPVGFHWLNSAYLVSNLMVNLVLLGGMLFVMMATSGQWLIMDVFSILPLLLVTAAGAYGTGFMMGGLALIYKRIQASFQILQFVFVAFLAIPLGRYPLARFLPLAMGNS